MYGENPQIEYGGPKKSLNNSILDRAWLEEFGGLIGLRVNDLVENFGLKKSELDNISRLLNKRPKDFVRKNEADFKENNIKNIIENDAGLINEMVKYPKIIERPIVLYKDKAVIGRPPENVLQLLNS